MKEETKLCNLVETNLRVWILRQSKGPEVRARALAATEVDIPRKYCRYYKNREYDGSVPCDK